MIAEHDVLVVGAGCAGMRAAIEAHDAGADVAGTLTGLTSSLRDELERLDATTPDTLVTQLEAAVDRAVAGADDVSPGAAAAATVTCAGDCAFC